MSEETLRERVRDLMPQAQQDLTEMVGFRSVHDAEQQPPEECDKMVAWLEEAFTEAGLADVAAHELSLIHI